MDNFIHSLFDCLWNFTDKLADKNLLPFVIGLIVLAVGISFYVQLMQIKRVSQRFADGVFDEKTIRLCERFKRRSIFPQSAELHDLFCCRLSAIYMEKREESLFFENLNSIKNVTQNISWRLYFLLTAYLTNQTYLEIVATYRTVKTENHSAIDFVEQLLQEYDRNAISDKAIVLKEKIANQQVLEILFALTKEP